jgi:hypothetical protein
MIITEDRSKVTNTLSGEVSQFSIATNAKAFRVLVDGIYADKIGSITRELLSNAFDAHTRRGNLDTPFEVRIPNPLNPTFSVRDYGCSMDHEFVMRSYSTLFESSKADSNTEVGAFGLGAKAFLAYTDACTLTCWSDGEVRNYSISIADSGVPEVRLVHRGPSTAEQGVEVTFAVAHTDFVEFRRAALRCAYGFDTLPTFMGDDVSPVEPDFNGEGWRFWRNGPLTESRIAVRQGCAIYPTNVGGWLVPMNALLIVDTPIGTANVTASRESLALTSAQRDGIDERVRAALEALGKQVETLYHAQPTEIRKAHFAHENRPLLPKDGDFPTTVQSPQSLHKWDAGSLAPYDRWSVQNLTKIVLVHDDGTPVLRRLLRLRALCKTRSVYIETDLNRLKEMHKFLELDRSQLVRLVDIPDVQVRRSPRGTSSTSTPKVKKEVAQDVVWAVCNRNKCEAGPLKWHRTDEHVGQHSGVTSHVARWIGEVVERTSGSKPVLFLTTAEMERALSKGTIDPELRIDRVVARELDSPTLHDQLLNWLVHRQMNVECAHHARRAMFEVAGVSDLGTPFSLGALFAMMKSDVFRRCEQEAIATVRALKQRYPLLFNSTADAVVQQYIAMCDAASTSKVA